jgi:hypothetical protein
MGYTGSRRQPEVAPSGRISDMVNIIIEVGPDPIPGTDVERTMVDDHSDLAVPVQIEALSRDESP